MRTRFLFLFVSILAAGLIAPPVSAAGQQKSGEPPQIRKFHESEAVLKASASAPDKGIPRSLLERAECIGVFPGLTKAAFVVGGEFGRGVFTCRQKDGTMGAPALFTIGGGSFGWQFGGEQADLVLLIMNPDGVKHLLQDKFTLGGEAAAVAGPVGRTAEAATDAQMHAEILSWSRSRGIFLGASIGGAVLKPDRSAIEDVYGKSVSASDILVAHSVAAPGSAQAFVRTASELSKRAS
jgi:lipid-binding SYLF domain-containing protein